jgi:hypothetical protein
MPTLTARFKKVEPLHISAGLLSQLVDVLEEVGQDVEDISNMTTTEEIDVNPDRAQGYAEALRELIDQDGLSSVRYPLYWNSSQYGRMVVKKDTSKDAAVEKMRSAERRHIYRNPRTSSSNLLLEELPVRLKEEIAETSAFMFLSRGFSLKWI